MELTGSNGSIPLAGFTYGSFAANNTQNIRQGVVVPQQRTESVPSPTPAPTAKSEANDSSSPIDTIPCLASPATVLIMDALAFWLWDRGNLCSLLSQSHEASRVTAVSELP